MSISEFWSPRKRYSNCPWLELPGGRRIAGLQAILPSRRPLWHPPGSGALLRLQVREARPLEDPGRRRRRGHRPLRPEKSCRAPNRRALPTESCTHNFQACPMLLWPLGGACNPRLQRELPFKQNRHQKKKKKSSSSVTVAVAIIYRQI